MSQKFFPEKTCHTLHLKTFSVFCPNKNVAGRDAQQWLRRRMPGNGNQITKSPDPPFTNN
jgi:hypothetical protein